MSVYRRARNLMSQQLLSFLLCCLVLPPVLVTLFTNELHYRFPFDLPPDVSVYGIGPVESGEKGLFRWFAARSRIRLQALSDANHLLFFEVHGGGIEDRRLDISVNNVHIAQKSLRPGWNRMFLLIPAMFLRSDANELVFEIEPLPPYNETKFGMAVTKLEIVQLAQGAMPKEVYLWLLLIAVTVYLGVSALRLPLFERICISVGVTVALSYALSVARLPTVQLFPSIVLTSLFVSGCWGVWQAGLRFWRQHSSMWLARLSVVAGVLFVCHVVGMNASLFIDIDHRARANHVLLIASGQSDIVQSRLSNQYEWGIDVIPYSLVSYYPFVPLAAIFPSTEQMTIALKLLVSVINASTPLLLYLLLVRSGYTPRAGFFAGTLFAGFPVTHLYFHDGSYPTIIGVWWVVLTLLIMNEVVRHERWSWLTVSLIIGMLLVAMLIYVTHMAFVPLVVGLASLFAWCARAELAVAGSRVLAALGISIVLALALYYGHYVLPTLIALAARLAESDRLGHDRLPSPLVGSLFAQMWGHTRVLPLVLVPLGIVGLARRGWTWTASVMAGYLVLLVLGMLIDHQFSLWNKHWYFSLPALAILVGVALDQIAEYHTAGKVVAGALVSYLLVESTVAWLLRVFLYQWSLQTL
ncbi:hypothetical protein [uncultured Chloroflexus sp.]|uniref:hypothetical protein n=2 Tax=uncultured Chloroflexus sp. TaxID=214040 RepID=UPI00262B99FF|nr:hypothetical protein [uncultured Chloroflexus sp.]